MWEKFIAWLNGMDPGVIKTSILAIAGGFTSLIGTLMGEHQNLFYWLFAFVVVDYFTGIFAAAKTGTWSSARGLKGLIRKFLILFIAIGFHGYSAGGFDLLLDNIRVSDNPSGAIDSVNVVPEEQNAEYYDLRGLRVDPSALTPGFYIRRTAGTTEKIIIR